FISKQFCLDKASQPKFDAQLLLCVGDEAHQGGNLGVHIQFVVVQHEALDAVGMVEVHHLTNDVLGGAHADTPQKRTHSSTATPAAERAAQLGDHGERPRSVDTVLIGRDIDQ